MVTGHDMLKKIGEVCPAIVNDYTHLECGGRDRSQTDCARVGRADRAGGDSGGVPHFPGTLPAYLDTGLADAPGRELEPACRRWPIDGGSGRIIASGICSDRRLIFRCDSSVYANDRRFLWPLLATSVAVASYAAVRALWWPDVFVTRVVFQVCSRMIALAAAIQLIRYRWARAEIGPWLLGLSMLLLHPDWSGATPHLLTGTGGMVDLLLGTSMLLLVLDESRMRTRRLGVIQTLTNSMARSLQSGPMLETALTELKALMGAEAAWFRLLEGEKMVIVQQIGLSRDFLRERASVPKDDAFERGFQSGKPVSVEDFCHGRKRPSLLAQRGFRSLHCDSGPGQEVRYRHLDSRKQTPPAIHAGGNGFSGHHCSPVRPCGGESAAAGTDSALAPPVDQHF